MKRALLTGVLLFIVASPALAMSATFSWKGVPRCSSVSPAFFVSGAPKGTARLKFSLRDYDAPNFAHGGSTVDSTGGRVPRGAISYSGPCPPAGETHRYIWTVEAQDASGAALMAITVSGAYPPD